VRILALDLATNVGWALGDIDGAIRHDTQRLAGASANNFGALFGSFDHWVSDMITVYSPDRIVFEAPIVGHSSMNAARVLLGLVSIAELIAHRRGLPCWEVAVSTARKHFCGSGRAKKEDVISRCHELGFTQKDHNAADAIALYHYAAAKLAKRAA
jgi:Holliday junction resolvasome RuvABC endonuclease subunit